MNEQKIYYTAEDVRSILGVSLSKAYQIIKELNEDLRKKNYIVIRGRVSKAYFNERIYR